VKSFSCFETRSAPVSLAATHRGRTLHVTEPQRSILAFLIKAISATSGYNAILLVNSRTFDLDVYV
jgi:hypothetical protein